MSKQRSLIEQGLVMTLELAELTNSTTARAGDCFRRGRRRLLGSFAVVLGQAGFDSRGRGVKTCRRKRHAPWICR